MKLLDLLFPPRCLACRNFGGPGSLCDSCREKFPRIRPPFCPLCSRPFEGEEGEGHLCGACLMDPPPFTKAVVLGRYQGLLLDLIGRMKYGREERIGSALGTWLGDLLAGEEGKDLDLVVPVPLSPRRLKARGFNQAVLMGRSVARLLGVRSDPFLLVKTRDTPPQTTLSGPGRRENLKGAFSVVTPERVEKKRILLVDDVYTTGTTLSSCAKALLRAGAGEVWVGAAARAA